MTPPGLESRSYASACHVLRDPKLRARVLGPGELEFNEMEIRPTLDRRPVPPEMISRCRERCECELKDSRKHRLKLALADLELALLQVAREQPYHPVRDYLEGLVWNGQERLSLLPGMLGAPASPLVTAMLREFMISAVARALAPGCKVDTALILVGRQGAYKSGFFRALAGSWFSDTPMTIGDKDSLLVLCSAWIHEWAELESVQRAARSASVKAFLSSSEDLVRAPYERAPRRYPRACVIVGSTNDEQFLTDPTGGRRYWVVPVSQQIDLAAITTDRDQLWAEAVHAYRAGEPWWLSASDERALRLAQKKHEVEDPWAEDILRFAAAQPDGVTTARVLNEIRVLPAQQTKASAMRVAAVLTAAGYRRTRGRVSGVGGRRPWVYRRRGGKVSPLVPVPLEVDHG